ncbi:MAG: branched-chain amino acid ABC transporter permease [Gemmatimonadales bacterium]
MTPLVLLEHLANGVVVGTYYVILALGLSIIFGMIGFINLAHGAFFAIGAYTALALKDAAGFGGALVMSPILVAVLGMAIEVTILRRLYKGDPLLGLLFTFGLAMVTEQVIRIVAGAGGYPFDAPAALRGSVQLGGFVYSRYRLFTLLCAALAIVGLWLFLEKTRVGTIIRAGTRDPEMVRLLGISLRPVFTAVFGIGIALAAIAGVLSAPLAGVEPAMGTKVGTAAFVVVVIGGLGSFWGPVIAGILVGEIVSFSILFWPPAAEASMYLLMAVILLVRPRGLLGERWEKFE